MREERLTEDLLRRLIEASSPEAYLDLGETMDRSLADYLAQLLEDRGMLRSDVVRGSGVTGSVVYDIFAGKSRPGRDNAIMLAFGLGCDLRQTQRLLRLAGVSELWPKVRRDAIVIWCIQQGLTRAECDDQLWRLGEATLLPGGADATE